MRIGVMMGATGGNDTIDGLIEQARAVEAANLDNVWLANIFTVDAISALSIVGHQVPRIGMGTAVTPTYPRHPTALAQQALTAAAATGNRFSLGIGLSHQVVIENMFGMSYDKPALHMREYLEVLMPLLRGGTVNFNGDQYRVNGVRIDVPGAEAPPVIVAALGPVMLKLAGELADGTTTWMVGPKTLENHIIKSINKAANGAGKSDAVVVGGLPVVLTTKPDEAREFVAKTLAMYGQLPSYRAMLDREGAAGPADVALAGDENYLRGELRRLEEIGVTDFNAAIVSSDDGAFERTFEFLASLKG